MPHLSVMAFPRKEPFLAMGPEALSYLRAQWEWGQVRHTLDFFFFEVGASEHVSQPFRWPQSCPDILSFVPK